MLSGILAGVLGVAGGIALVQDYFRFLAPLISPRIIDAYDHWYVSQYNYFHFSCICAFTLYLGQCCDLSTHNVDVENLDWGVWWTAIL